jgi:hypothetical protein
MHYTRKRENRPRTVVGALDGLHVSVYVIEVSPATVQTLGLEVTAQVIALGLKKRGMKHGSEL